MRRLVIDSATEACSVALFDGHDLVAGAYAVLGRGHAEQLVPMIAALPGKGCADMIAVNVGPGSFTGIRVGLAAARALSLAWAAPLAGYSSLALVAAMAQAAHPGTAIDVAMTGGHGEWFFQPFGADGGADAEAASLSPDQVVAASRADCLAGSQAEALGLYRGQAQIPMPLITMPLWPDARAFASLAPQMLRPDPSPRYGRAPDARLPAA